MTLINQVDDLRFLGKLLVFHGFSRHNTNGPGVWMVPRKVVDSSIDFNFFNGACIVVPGTFGWIIG